MGDDHLESNRSDVGNYLQLQATSLVEFLNVIVKGDYLTEHGNCEIYGKISISDELYGRSFDIYDRGEDDPQSISIGDDDVALLLINLPLDAAYILPLEYVDLNVELKDRARGGILMSKNSITLDRTTHKQVWEDYRVQHVPTLLSNLNIVVHYAILPYAVTATISVLYFHKEDHFDLEGCPYNSDCPGLAENLDDYDPIVDYGNPDRSSTLTAAADLCGNLYASTLANDNDDQGSHSRRCLLSCNRGQDVESGGFIPLSRSVVVVPAYSSLHIDATFYHRGTKTPVASANVIFKPCDRWKAKEDIKGENGERIRVRVIWQVELNHGSSLKRIIPDIPVWVVQKQNSCSTSFINNCMFKSHITPDILTVNSIFPRPDLPYAFMEVYSIVVCRKDGKPFQFHGSVIVHDGHEYIIFNREATCPQDCRDSGTIAMVESPSWCFAAVNDFSICVHFLDSRSNIVISKGNVNHRGLGMYLVHNKRMCCVIRGADGFAAIHYACFPDGVKAFVSVKLHGKKLMANVKGQIYARFGNEESSRRCHQEELFKSRLFYQLDDGIRLSGE